MGQSTQEWKNYDLGKLAYKKLEKGLSVYICLYRPYRFTFFQGWLSRILLGPFLNVLSCIQK